MSSSVLVVDDQPGVLDVIGTALRQANFTVITASDGATAVSLARAERPSAVILEVMLPQMDGYEVCRILRREPPTAAIPIIMLSARTAELDRIVGLELGADDYVTKPFSPRELVVRLRKLLSRQAAGATEPPPVRREELGIDLARHEVSVDGRPVDLTVSEFKLLALLAREPGRNFSRDELLQHVWQREAGATSRTVDTHMCRLRDKLGAAAYHLQTVRGLGYRFRRNGG